jgi:chromosome segregation ATPase
MSGDVRHFRRKFFGGFDTSDVMLYIEELAAQRNKYKTTGDKLELELKSLSSEIKRLQSELDSADRRISDIKVRSLDEAGNSITTLKETYTNIRTEMESTTSTISSELSRLNNTLASLSSVLDKTGYRFTELQTLVEHEKAEAISAHSSRYIH